MKVYGVLLSVRVSCKLLRNFRFSEFYDDDAIYHMKEEQDNKLRDAVFCESLYEVFGLAAFLVIKDYVAAYNRENHPRALRQ